ncbi:hypothetical protein [Photobacterium sp. DNB22_13_2]
MNSIYPFEYNLDSEDYNNLSSVFHQHVENEGFEYKRSYTDNLLSYFMTDLSIDTLKCSHKNKIEYRNDFEMLNDPIFNHQYSMIKDYNVNFNGITTPSLYCELHSLFEVSLLDIRVSSSVIKIDYVETPFDSNDICTALECRLSTLITKHTTADVSIQTEHNSDVKMANNKVVIDKHAMVSVIYHNNIIEIAEDINNVVNSLSQKFQFQYNLLHEHEVEIDELKYFNTNNSYKNHNIPILKKFIKRK